MPEALIDQVRALLFRQSKPELALLFDLIPLLPDDLLERAIWLAKHTNNELLRGFLVRDLVERVPSKAKRLELTGDFPLPQGFVPAEILIPTGKEVRRLISRLPEGQRYEVLDQLLFQMERAEGLVEESAVERPSREEEDDEFRGGVFGMKENDTEPSDVPEGDLGEWVPKVRIVDPPENMGGGPGGGGGPTAAKPLDWAPPPPQPSPAPPKPPEQQKRRDIVNLGFSRGDAADKTLSSQETLQTGKSYFFWLNIGYEHKDAIGPATPIDLDKLPEEALLTVAIFGFPDEIAITSGEDVGELRIQKNSVVKVVRQPTHGRTEPVPLSSAAGQSYLEDFVLFPVQAPSKAGTYRLRCNIYCAQVLVQSYLLAAAVTTEPATVPEACSKKLDYVLSETLRPTHLASMTAEPHLLSLQLNSNGNDANFRFYGAHGDLLFKDDAQVDGQTLTSLLKQARGAMRRVSWGNEQEWVPGQAYRYQNQVFDRAKLARDLAYLARAGWRIYNTFLQHLATTGANLESLMANPGAVQIALKLSPRAVLPAAIVYDYRWRPDNFPDFDQTPFELCPTFSAAIDKANQGGPPLEECDCFKSGCALKAEIDRITAPGSNLNLTNLPPVICPSGFWGYRHSLGLPFTLDGSSNEAPPVISFKDDLELIACVSTDPQFIERDPHLKRLEKLKTGLKFQRGQAYDQVVTSLRQSVPHLLYFYCHGGTRLNSDLPYLEIGDSDVLSPDFLFAEGISWKEPHPLVFINGCHTTSLSPEITLDFVSSFVQQAGAAGVIGTEITIFERLASKFAEECLSRFVGAPPHQESMPIGKSVRGARLELLRQGNPLGLVYIPFTIASLRLQKVPTN